MIHPRRGFYRFTITDPAQGNSGDLDKAKRRDVVATTWERAELIGSKCVNLEGYHMPVIDLDLPCTLVESRTKGHHHLLIHTPVKWEDYINILSALVSAGIVQKGYLQATIARGEAFVRVRPGVGAQEYAGLAAQGVGPSYWRRVWNVLRGRHSEDIDF